MGQPKKGDRDNVHSIKADQLREFHSTNFFGDNIVVVGAGNINHEELLTQLVSISPTYPSRAQELLRIRKSQFIFQLFFSSEMMRCTTQMLESSMMPLQ